MYVCMCMCVYIYIYIYIPLSLSLSIYIYIYSLFVRLLFVVTHRVFHTRLPGVCSGGRSECPPESLNGSDA